MGHYALLDDKNIVVQVITGKDENEGVYNWEKFYEKETGYKCKRTSYNTIGGVHRGGGIPFRKNYAGIGYSYDESRDAFIQPKPYPSWLLNEQTCVWEAPVPYPADGNLVNPDSTKHYRWDEPTLSWVEVT